MGVFSNIKNFVKTVSANQYAGPNNYDRATMGSFYNLSAVDIDGNDFDFKQLEGKVALVINVASLWGKTESSYRAMKKVHEKYGKDGKFTILAFPCNQFKNQEPWDHPKIKAFAQERGATYPLFSKIHVNGPDQHSVYDFLKKCFPGDISWNFSSKFIIDQNGNPIQRFNDSFSKESNQDSWSRIDKLIGHLIQTPPGPTSDAAGK